MKEITTWHATRRFCARSGVMPMAEWVRRDVGKVFVMNFEWTLNAWIGNPSPVCIHAEQCGRALVLEHNGDVFVCDHSVYPEYRLGSVPPCQYE
jgi:uncharacterized protein